MSQPPEARFQVGGVTASVFVNRNSRADGSTFDTRNTVLQRTYRQDDGTYKTTTSFGVSDLPKAIVALVQAYVHCVARPTSNQSVNE